MTKTKKLLLECRYNPPGIPDEVVCEDASVHLEQLAGNEWWMVVTDRKGNSVNVYLKARGKITATFMEETQ